MSKFKHYILTRFNQGIYDKPKSAEWMDHRMRLFEKYTLPSVLAQTNKDFQWVLSFDPRTPDDVLTRYDYVDHVIVTFDTPANYVKAWHPKTHWCITSRLDNDDYLERNYIADIQRRFRDSEMVVDFRGRALDTKTGVYFTTGRSHPNSMFVSLIEDGLAPQTVLHTEHSHINRFHEAVMIPRYGWVMVCHEKNIANSISSRPNITSEVPQTLYV